MKLIKQTKHFRNDFRRVKKRGKDPNKLFRAVELMTLGEPLPMSLKAHRLSGQWSQAWECHLEADWLLIYSISELEICLIRTGTHADLFE